MDEQKMANSELNPAINNACSERPSPSVQLLALELQSDVSTTDTKRQRRTRQSDSRTSPVRSPPLHFQIPCAQRHLECAGLTR